MIDQLRESEDNAVRGTLLSSYCPAPVKEAREKQDEILIRRFKGGAYRIADVGSGDGYHGAIFGRSGDAYHGFEIAPEIAEIARERWRSEGLDNASVFVGDATDAQVQPDFYDIVWCLYFTPGNFRDKSADLSIYTDSYLNRNPVFIKFVTNFHQGLKFGGSMFLTVYKDVPAAEAAQIDFYEHTGQHVVTPKGARFVATRENFWSVRWSEASMLSNLRGAGIKHTDVMFHDLNEIAWLVEITRQ